MVMVREGYTEYRYGRYVSANGKHDCWCGRYLENLSYVTGKAVLDHSDWSTAAYPANGKSWSCGYCGGTHTGADHIGADGKNWWKEYVSPDGKSYYWQESREVAPVYSIEYRYRELIMP